MKALNIGCGSTFSSDWTNVDLVSSAPEVEACDIKKGLPFPDNSFDACYSSHVLEHLTQSQAYNLVKECFRVLKPGGIIRIVVPDLEQIARLYLDKLEQVRSGVSEAEADYDWIMLELYDQTVRQIPGGQIAKYLQSPNLQNKEFIRSRLGTIASEFWKQDQQKLRKSWLEKIKQTNIWQLFDKFKLELVKILVGLLASKSAKAAFEEGLFRYSGEIHYWMYDSFSLKRMLKASGFREILCCQANESSISDFNSYDLDIVNGLVRIPQSLYMEGVKPVNQ